MEGLGAEIFASQNKWLIYTEALAPNTFGGFVTNLRPNMSEHLKCRSAAPLV